MKNNTWYIKDNINSGTKIPNLSEEESKDLQIIKLNENLVKTIRELLSKPFFNDRTRCISFYRDTIVIDNKVYNICLSCGDINFDDKNVMITQEQEIALKELKQIIRNKNTARDFIDYDESRFPNPEALMIKFAKYHVKKALESVKTLSEISFVPHDEESWNQKSIEREDILDFYDDGTSDIDFQYEQLRNRDGFTIEIDEESILDAYPLENIK